MRLDWKGYIPFVVCCLLAVGIIGKTMSWMEQNAARLNADTALLKAQQSVHSYCVKHRISQCNPQLTHLSVPSSSVLEAFNTAGQWTFEFEAKPMGKFQVEVPENGEHSRVMAMARN